MGSASGDVIGSLRRVRANGPITLPPLGSKMVLEAPNFSVRPGLGIVENGVGALGTRVREVIHLGLGGM